MPTKEDLILENELLRKKLALAEAWMRREVAYQQKSIREIDAKKSGRKKLDNILEREGVDIITRRIIEYFGDSLQYAPKHTLEHLIDAEIYWQTLQKFPTLDALPVVSSYQKILDAFFERILQGFRTSHREGRSDPVSRKSGLPRRSSQIQTHSSQSLKQEGSNGLDRDIQNVLEKKYTLSLGRWYQFFEKVRKGDVFSGKYADMLLLFLTSKFEYGLESVISDPFFSQFKMLIDMQVFSKKRHESKINYKDASIVRDTCMCNEKESSLIYTLLQEFGREI